MKIKIPSKNSLLEQEEFEVKVLYDKADDFYTINALNTKGEVVCTATAKPQRSLSQMWLYKISTVEGYQHKGYATAVIKTLEYLTSYIRYSWIEGKFYPDNQYAKPFYDKHGYTIYKDDYETFVTKTIDYDDIKQNIEPNISDFKIETQAELER